MGAGEAASASALFHGWAGGARIVLHTEFFPPLLSREWALSGLVDSLAQENFSGILEPKLTWYNYEINILNIVLLEKILKTKIYLVEEHTYTT